MSRRVGYWVRFDGKHGNGHQGRFTKYKWFEKDQDKDSVREYVEDELSSYYNTLSVKWECVRKPPKKARDRLIADYKSNIKYAKIKIEHSKTMIKILEK